MHDPAKYNPTERFSNRAKHYAKARPDYPLEGLEFICSNCGLKEASQVCDIGAGTGISTRAMASIGMRITGVEPNEAMLAEASANPEWAESIKYVRASAESTGLADGEFDAVTCAQAFHWFDPEKALDEFSRILKPEGWVVLIWNERDESCPFTKSYGDLLRNWPDTSKVENKRQQSAQFLMDTPSFKNASKKDFANDQVMDLDKLVGRALSASYAPPPDSQAAAEFSDKLRKLFAEYVRDGNVTMKYACSVYSAQKR